MNTFKKEIKNRDHTVDIVFAKSSDNYDISIGDNYKLIKFSNNKKAFNDSLLGSDIGIHSKGFASILTISIIIATLAIALIINSFRI